METAFAIKVNKKVIPLFGMNRAAATEIGKKHYPGAVLVEVHVHNMQGWQALCGIEISRVLEVL